MTSRDTIPHIRPVRPERKSRRRPRTPNPEVRRRLLDAAVRLIRREGFPALRIEEIADEAGLSVGTFYLYFDGKPDLFVNMVVEFTEELTARIQSIYEGGGSVAERLARGLDVYIEFAIENKRGFVYFRDAGGIETTAGRLNSWAFAQHAAQLRPLLVEAMEEGLVRREDPDLLAQAIVGLNQHMIGHWLERGGDYPKETIKTFLLTLVARGIQP